MKGQELLQMGHKAAESPAHVGNKVLPICEASVTSSTSTDDQCVSSEKKEKQKCGDKNKTISRMKELLRWAAASQAEKGGSTSRSAESCGARTMTEEGLKGDGPDRLRLATNSTMSTISLPNRSVVGSAYGSYPPLREDGLRQVTRGDGGTPITDRESSCVGVRRTCARPSVIVNEAVTNYLRRSPGGGLRRLVLQGRGAREEESGFRPSRYGEATGSIMPWRACNQRVFRRERRRGGHGSEQGRQHDVAVRRRFTSSMIRVRRRRRKRLVKKSGDEREGALILGLKMKNRRS
ncbi:hypothetical protein Syun_006513 [Stephania yunnanensis]|uniref:Uncharacterized protein n=1 Tax=Stephania yunnanensis TaxID=152371 RepID=A0AAP0KYE0_9MAGN